MLVVGLEVSSLEVFSRRSCRSGRTGPAIPFPSSTASAWTLVIVEVLAVEVLSCSIMPLMSCPPPGASLPRWGSLLRSAAGAIGFPAAGSRSPAPARPRPRPGHPRIRSGVDQADRCNAFRIACSCSIVLPRRWRGRRPILVNGRTNGTGVYPIWCFAFAVLGDAISLS